MRHKVGQSSGNRFGKVMCKGIPPPSRSPMGMVSLVYVWVVWEKNFVGIF